MRILMIPLLILIILFFICIPILIKLLWPNKKIGKTALLTLAVLYGFIVLFFTLTNVKLGKFIEVSFETSGEWFNKKIYIFEKFNFVDIIINLAMLIPIGIFVYNFESTWIKNCIKSAISGLVFGLLIEGLQFVLPNARTVQIHDILLNSISSIIGTLFMFVICIIFVKKKKRRCL